MNKMSTTALARTHLALAEQAPNGRSFHAVVGGHEHALRRHIRPATTDTSWDGHPGDLLIVPSTRHSFQASVVLLTVAKS